MFYCYWCFRKNQLNVCRYSICNSGYIVIVQCGLKYRDIFYNALQIKHNKYEPNGSRLYP